MGISSETDSEARTRGRPKRQAQPFRFGSYVYNTPLGFQYTQQMMVPLASSLGPHRREASPPPAPMRRERRSAAVRLLPVKKKRRHASEESEPVSEERESVEEDPYERLLRYDEEGDRYWVKFRNRSYLHCEWVPASEIKGTRVGAMKAKRFRAVEPDADLTTVERVLAETAEDGHRVVLVKWKGLPYEASTYEDLSAAEPCVGFAEAYAAFRDRKRMRHMRVPLDWRPARENQLKYAESPAYRQGNALRSYQLEGLNWLLNRWYYKQSCIMADEMGLGKTVQSVAFVNALFTAFEYSAPVLVVAPLSTLVHWEREFKNWTNLRVLTYHGSISGRSVIANYEFFLKAGNIAVRLFDVIITTYEMAMAGAEHLGQFEFGAGIFDEAHRLKNPASKAAQCLRALSVQHKVLLSGTPIQNNLNELWALFNFIDPQHFASLPAFLDEYRMERAQDVDRLQALLKPIMLRRMKEDVETSIPMKEETIIEVELTMIQKRYYRAILEKNIEFLTKGDKGNAPNLINAMMELRKCCIHPYLLKGAEDKIISDYAKRHPSQGIARHETEGAAHIGDFFFSDIDEYYRILVQSSGKLVLLDKLLAKLHGHHKVLIFSQMTRCLDLLAEYLAHRRYRYERIDGGVRGDLRQAAIDRFSSGEAFVFLLCTRAGGVGINLTAADTVVIFDSDWNPQNDLQAQARCHRIGQKNEVKIYRLITKNSYEREMFDKAGLKLGLDRAILQKMSFDQHDGDTPARKEDAIQLLLRKGAYGVLMDTDDASQRFCEEDIDQILERRTRIIKHEDGGNVFSKATFQVDEDIEDPDFWENLLTQRRSEENEGRIKRQCRRLAREGVLTEEDRKCISEIVTRLENSNGNNVICDDGICDDNNTINSNTTTINATDVNTTNINSINNLDLQQLSNTIQLDEGDTTAELEIFTIFIKTLHGSPMDAGIDLAAETIPAHFGNLVKYCADLVTPAKLKADFTLFLDRYQADYDPNLFLRFADLYLKYHEQFLFRVQVPVILRQLVATEDIHIEKTRGWTHDDDKTIVAQVIARGYDNFTLREKPREEVNQRVRKIIGVLFHRKEMKENDNMYFQTLLNFGRPTDKNEFAIEKFLRKDPSKLSEIVERITSMSKRLRRDTADADIYDRIAFFDRLEEIETIPVMRKATGMPRKWDAAKDAELRDHLLAEGFVGAVEKFGVSEDAILKRFDCIFKAANVPAKE